MADSNYPAFLKDREPLSSCQPMWPKWKQREKQVNLLIGGVGSQSDNANQ